MNRRWIVPVGLVIGWLVASTEASPSAPDLLSYQGVLTLTDGTVVQDGSYSLTFEIYDDPTSTLQANRKFAQTLTVEVRSGLYNVILSNQGGYVLSDAFDDPQRYMQVTIESGPGISGSIALEPRQQIASVPFALVSQRVVETPVIPDPPDPIPTNAIILWDASATCPAGYALASEYAGLTVRGARDPAVPQNPQDPNVPQNPGVNCPGGVDCNTQASLYDDVLDFDEMPTLAYSTILGQGDIDTDGGGGVEDSLLSIGNPHYHGFRTVLFCRKL